MASDGFTPRQLEFLALRPAYKTDSDCADAVGVHREKVYDWKRRQPAFKEAYERVLEVRYHDLAEYARKKLEAVVDEATDEMIHLLRTSNQEWIRFKAACEVLDIIGAAKVTQADVEVSNEFRELIRDLREIDGEADTEAP